MWLPLQTTQAATGLEFNSPVTARGKLVEHTLPILRHLHWVPVCFQVQDSGYYFQAVSWPGTLVFEGLSLKLHQLSSSDQLLSIPPLRAVWHLPGSLFLCSSSSHFVRWAPQWGKDKTFTWGFSEATVVNGRQWNFCGFMRLWFLIKYTKPPSACMGKGRVIFLLINKTSVLLQCNFLHMPGHALSILGSFNLSSLQSYRVFRTLWLF